MAIREETIKVSVNLSVMYATDASHSVFFISIADAFFPYIYENAFGLIRMLPIGGRLPRTGGEDRLLYCSLEVVYL